MTEDWKHLPEGVTQEQMNQWRDAVRAAGVPYAGHYQDARRAYLDYKIGLQKKYQQIYQVEIVAPEAENSFISKEERLELWVRNQAQSETSKNYYDATNNELNKILRMNNIKEEDHDGFY